MTRPKRSTIGIQTTETCLGFEKLPQSLRSQLSSEALHDLAQFPADWPELELLPLAGATVATNDSDNYASFTIAVLATTSRGNVTINSTDTSLNPLISPNWLLTQTDQKVAIQGLKRARQIAAASGVTAMPEFAPGPTIETDAQILDYIQQSLAPIHHASATCEQFFKLPGTGTRGVLTKQAHRCDGQSWRCRRGRRLERKGIRSQRAPARRYFRLSVSSAGTYASQRL